MSELTVRPATELLSMLESGAISTVELVEEHLREIERLNGSLRAFVDVDAERCLRAAREADMARRTGCGGLLGGLPVSIKSSIEVAGYHCETGTALHRGHIPATDAVAVTRMRQAGAVILGTTNCPEFLMAYETSNLLYGATANPWALDHSAGGSSGGEAAAIAAGLSAGGIGSDSGGSVREPAHFTGICSFKPTSGRIPSEGHTLPCLGPFSLLGCLGPMARTMEDVSLFFEVLSSGSRAKPGAGPQLLSRHSVKDLRSRTIGVLEDDGLAPVSAETRLAVRAAAEALRGQGFEVRTFQSSQLEAARRLWWTFFMRCGRLLLEPQLAGHEEELSPTFRYFLDTARAEPLLTADELLAAWVQSDLVRAALEREMAPYAALLTPVCSIPAFRHGERSWNVEGRPLEYFEAMRFTQWFNLLGAPAAVVPVAQSAGGLPIGVQVAGCPHHDEEVVAIAGLLDREFGYRPPPVAVASVQVAKVPTELLYNRGRESL